MHLELAQYSQEESGYLTHISLILQICVSDIRTAPKISHPDTVIISIYRYMYVLFSDGRKLLSSLNPLTSLQGDYSTKKKFMFVSILNPNIHWKEL